MADDKMRILYLMRILLDETDENHPLNASQIAEKMDLRYQFSYNRKTVYSDVERLRSYGLEIAQLKGNTHGYYISRREFDLPELKLLVDAVQSSKFITRQKSEELIGKLEKLTSRENARLLHRQVFIYNRIKTDNERIYANVDAIHAAIHANRQIRFKYCEWTVRKELALRKDGADYVVSPWALTWDDENYYLVAHDEISDQIRHYRVDKMQDTSVTEEVRQGRARFEGFDLAAFARKTFGMYGGEERKLTLEGENHLAGVVIDRFGQEVSMFPWDAEHFHAGVTVAVSSQFFGWLAGIGSGLRITWPEDVRNQYRAYLQEILDGMEA